MAEVIAVNRYVLQDAEAFDRAVAALVTRVRAEGHPGVRAYRFYRPGAAEGRAVVNYASPEAWVGHHEMIMGWPEMAALRAAGQLAEVQLFGVVTAAMEAWIARMGLGEKVREAGEPVAGFMR
jgi:quinol monooxygenase YgiN